MNLSLNLSRDPVRHSLSPAAAAHRAVQPQPLLAAAPLTRASLPVTSNRAFIGAWMTRRAGLVAAARLLRSN